MAIILFDVGNVLVLCNHAITHAILQDYDIPKARSIRFFENEGYLQFSRGRVNSEEFHKVLIYKYLKCELTFQQIKYAHNYHIHNVNERVGDILVKLHSCHKVAIATNTNTWQIARVKELIDLSKYPQFNSNEMGMLKTDKGYFSYVLRKLSIKPKDAVLIDDKHANLQKAAECGIRGILYKNPEQLMHELKRLSLL